MANYYYSNGQQPAHSNLFQFLLDFVKHSYSIASIPLEKPVESFGHLSNSAYLKKINSISAPKHRELITIRIS